ncbi:MAG: O-antigen ligase family protein [Phycisphaerae bacterium]
MTQMDAPILMYDPPRRMGVPQVCMCIGGIVWGALTAFALGLASISTSALTVQGGGLLIGMLMATLGHPAVWARGARTWPTVFALANVIGAAMATVMTNSEPTSVMRYVLLLPTTIMFAGMARSNASLVGAMRLGLTIGGLTLVFSTLSHADWGQLLNPHYRYWAFLNPNGVAFISAMTCISLLDYAYRFLRKGVIGLPLQAGLIGLIASCALVMLVTKSRTATLALLCGTATYFFFKLGRRAAVATLIFTAIMAFFLSAVVNFGETGSEISKVFSLSDKYRSIDSGTGRFAGWAIIVRDLWLPHPLFGIGPSNAEMEIEALAGIPGAHNGILRNLVEGGLATALPLILWVMVAFKRGWKLRHTERGTILLALLVGGFVESGAETMFFSLGNPGSLLFILAACALLIDDPTDFPEAPEQHTQYPLAPSTA